MTTEAHVHLPADATARALLRHALATLAYRAAKVLRDLPPDFGPRSFGPATRQPVGIVAHMADLMSWGVSLAQGQYTWKAEGTSDWEREVERFFERLAELDREVATNPALAGSIEQLVQGPIADAFTHVGQLALLRGMAGVPVRPESYARAAIVPGRTGLQQEAPRKEFDGDASTR